MQLVDPIVITIDPHNPGPESETGRIIRETIEQNIRDAAARANRQNIAVVLYQGTDADLTLPIRILKAERIQWVVEDLSRAGAFGGEGIDPERGWYAYFTQYGQGASRWTEIYEILNTHGLLL